MRGRVGSLGMGSFVSLGHRFPRMFRPFCTLLFSCSAPHSFPIPTFFSPHCISFCFFIRFLALHFPVTSLVNVHPILLYPQDFLMLTIRYGIIIILITSQGKICVWTVD